MKVRVSKVTLMGTRSWTRRVAPRRMWRVVVRPEETVCLREEMSGLMVARM